MMKQSTSFAHVATNLLTLLQGYSKTIRLLLVMFVALSVSAEVWGADVTINVASETWTNAGTSGTGGTTMVSKSGVTVSSDKGYKDGTTAIREYSGGNITVSSNDNITKIVFTSTANMGSKYGPNCIALKSGSTGTYTTSSNSNLGTWTGTAKSITFSCSAQFRWTKIVVTIADAHTVTWTINPAAGGNLSATSGNTTTVTPDAAYTYDSPAYTVASGSAIVSQNGNTFTATPTANSTIQINMVAKASANISFENMGNPTPTTTGYYVGDTYTLPATNDYTCGDKTFVGWSTEIIENSATKPTAATYFEPGASVTLAANQTFYAVFAEGSGEETLTSICGGDWSNGVTSNWTTYGTGTYSGNGVKFDGENDYVLSPDLSSKNYTKLLLKFKSGYNGNKGSVLTFYAYNKNKTLLMDENVTINPETVVPGDTYTNQNNIYEVSISASEIIGQVMIKMTSKTSNLGMKYCEVFGVSSSHSNYTTICNTQPSYSVTSTLSHVTAGVGNPTTITSEAEELTLTYSAESGWNLPDAISVTMGGNQLMLNDGYTWDKETGTVWIVPTNGFTGNIVVTINGWQQLAEPIGLNVSNITSSTATLSWDAVANASSYLVTIVDGGDLSANIPNTQTSHTFEGLTPSTVYLWRVKAIGDGITYTNSEESKTAEFTTLKACEQLGAATGLTVETDFVQDGQTYVKFSWTPADNTKNYARNQKICFGKVDEAGTCVDNLAKNLTWTGDLKSKLEPGEYWWSIQALGDGVNYCDGDVVNGTNFTIEAPKASITLSELGVTTTDNTTYYVGAQYTLPTISSQSCAGKQLVGWSTVVVAETDTKPTSNYYELGAEVTLEATQTFYAVYATLTADGEGTVTKINADDDFYYGDKIIIIAENTNYGLYRSSSNNYVNYWTTSNNDGVPTAAEIEADSKRFIEISEGTTEGTIKLGNVTDGYLYNPSSTDLSISTTNASDWKLIAWNDNTFTFKAVQYLSCRTDFSGTNANKWRGAGSSCNCETGNNCSGIIYYNIYRYTSGTSYSAYATTCQQVESIEVQSPQTEFYLTNDFSIGEGKVMATLSDGKTKVDVTALATFSGYNMNVVGTYTVTVTYMGATATYNINVKPLDNAWVLTWNVSGKTNTGLGPRSVTKGSAIGTLPTPEVPAACEGKTFMGWTTSNIVHSDGTGITYITPATVPTDNTTYYAVFATVNNFSVQKPIDQIASGSKVVIVAVASLTDDGGAGMAISSRATDDAHNLQGDDVAIYDQTINTPHSTCIWTITKSGEKYIFTQDGKYLNGIIDGKYSNLKYNGTSDSWTLTPAASGMAMTYNMKSTNASTEYVEWYNEKFTIHEEVNDNGDFDMQFFVTANAEGNADITDYTTGCEEYTITYYGFRGGYSTSTSSDGIIVLPVNSLHTVPNCGDVVTDHTNLNRTFTGVWMTKPHGGHTFKPGDTFILTQDTTLYAQWEMETTSDVTTLPTDIEDMAGTDIYVYGGKTLNIQPGTTTINSLTLKGGLQADGSYKMPTVWVPEGATLVRNSNKIYLDLVVNAKNYYPFAVPFATKNDQYIDYLDPVLNAASEYGTHFVIKTYDGARRATQGEDKANNWVKVLRHATDKPSYLQPGVGYIITALTYPTKDTATIRIPMTVPNTWFKNGEQAEVGTTVRNTIAVTAHAGAATDINNGGHPRHAGWNFVANPYLTSFAGGNVANDGGLAYINGELTVNGGWQYGGDEVPYVTIPAYDFSYYTQHKLSDVKLSPEWSFFVQIGTSGTMDFSTAGRQETPASIAARHDAAQSIRMDVDIVLSDKHHSDQTGIIISDRFTSAYEIGRDLEKLFGSAYNLSVYTLMEDNTPLAFQALAIHSNMQIIPVGYRVPEQGEYTFRLNEATSSIDLLNEQYEQLILVDYETGALTNLLNSSYTFTSPRTQSNSRFAIYAVMRQGIPTDLPNIDDGDTSTRKILHNGHLYILRDGKVYNGHGQIVKQ